MKQLFYFLLSFTLLSAAVTVNAQEAVISDVKKKQFRGVKSIVDQRTGESVGYYAMYVSERAGIGKREFIIAIYDLDLNLTKELPIVMTKGAELEASTFNGSDFMFVFKNERMQLMTYVTADAKGELLKQNDVREKKPQEVTADVYPASGGKGFFLVKPDKEKKIGYKITYMDRMQTVKWETSLIPKKGRNEIEEVEVVGDKIIAVSVDYTSKKGDKGDGYLTAFKESDGKEIWTYPLSEGEFQNIPSAFLIDKAGDVVAGGIYFGGKKWNSNDAEGIFMLKLDQETGTQKVLTQKSWEKDLTAALKATTKKTIGKPKVFFEEIIETDGGYKFVGEVFRTTINAAEAAMGAMSKMGGAFGAIGGAAKAASKMKTRIEGRYIGDPNREPDGLGSAISGSIDFLIEDFVIMNWSKDGVMDYIKMIDKDPLSLRVYPPYTFAGGYKLARVVEDYGFFQYRFTTAIPGISDKVIVSSNMVSKPYIGMTDISGDEIGKTFEIPVNFKPAHMQTRTNDDFVGGVQSKQGKIMIFYFDKKEQKVYMYLEDLKVS